VVLFPQLFKKPHLLQESGPAARPGQLPGSDAGRQQAASKIKLVAAVRKRFTFFISVNQ